MKAKHSMRKQLTIFAGGILFMSTTLLVGLLFYNFYVSLSGFQIEINGKMVDFFFMDGLEQHLLFIGIFVDLLTTILGMIITYWWLGKVLKPLEDLAIHMDRSNSENIIQEAQIESSIQEFDSLIHSFNGLSRKLKESFDTQKQFSSYVAHEFRTPLAIMQTKLDVYKKSQDKDIDGLMENFSNQIQKLSDLVNNILDLSGIQKVELNERVPISLLLEEVIEDVEPLAQEKNIQIIYENALEYETELVLGNHELLYQAFSNIVQNAIKYNKEHGKIWLSIRKENSIILIDIQDTGEGIRIEDQDKIFDIFYRCHPTKNIVKGSGIGLPFSKKVFEHHDGTLQLKKSNLGACFEVCLKAYGGSYENISD